MSTPPPLEVVVAAPEGDWEPAVHSLLRQSLPPAGITVVGPAEGTDARVRFPPTGITVIGPADGTDARVRFVPRVPEAVAAACVEAARDARTPHVAFLHGRDEALPDWLRQLAHAAATGAGLVECGLLRLRPDGLVDGITIPPAPPGLVTSGYAVRRDLLTTGGGSAAHVTLPALLIRHHADAARTAATGPVRVNTTATTGTPRANTTAATGTPRIDATPAARAEVLRGTRLTGPTPGTPLPMEPPEPPEPRPHSTPNLISVVIPVRNGARTLPDQLRALAAQTYTGPWEVLVVDNGSTDATRDVAENARSSLPELRVIDAADQPGESRARNRGVASARGDFIAFCDADDQADPGWLAALARAARHADLLGGSLDSSVLSPAHIDEQPQPMTQQPDFLPFARGANCAAWKDVLTTIGGWDERYRAGGEDMDLSWRAHLCGYRVRYVPDARMHYRLRDELSALARQKWNYGKSGARLYAAYQNAGFERRAGRVVLANWSWLLLHTPDLLHSPARRRRWIRYTARLAGFLAGSIQQGVRYL
ncbi:glycosyltransferase [Streptomyces sp. NPDC003077]|uniref:glycosyltransferase n=1 Tax=Streptomyces sp. NPDC003077 TaxID=3154443 RepID=UPI00339EAD7A